MANRKEQPNMTNPFQFFSYFSLAEKNATLCQDQQSHRGRRGYLYSNSISVQDFIIANLKQTSFQVLKKSSGMSVIFKTSFLIWFPVTMPVSVCAKFWQSEVLWYIFSQASKEKVNNGLVTPGQALVAKSLRGSSSSFCFWHCFKYFTVRRDVWNSFIGFEAAGLMPKGDFWSTQVFCSCFR